MLRSTCFLALVTLLATAFSVRSTTAAQVTGEVKQWHTVTISIDGPSSDEDATPNPFTQVEMTAWFVHADTTRRYEVPGFFHADGMAANTGASGGNQWSVRFSPPLTGTWKYKIQIQQDGQPLPLEGASGEFSVSPSDKPANDFRSAGHLRYVGERYLKFAGSGRYFLKAGADSPETLLGYHDFDGTWHDQDVHPIAAPHPPIELPSLDAGLHRFETHVSDWKAGDPSWAGASPSERRGKGLIGGINYLAQHGVNSMYFVTMNVNGDGRNVWPWTGPWKHDRFDVSKLDQWEIVFEHMQSLGIQMHVVLQETENDHLLDSGNLGENRKRYLREMIARFAHHPAIVWNLGEENLQTVDQRRAMAEFIRSVDPYDHPIVVHNDHYSAMDIRNTFDPHLGGSELDGTAIQDFHWNDVHAHTKHYVIESREAGKPWVVCTDEMGGAQFGLPTDSDEPDHYNARSKGLWGNLMAGGGGVEWYFGWQNNSPESDLSAESWRPRESMWDQSKIAIDFFHQHLPFWEMIPADELTLADTDFCLAKPGEVYCIYLFSGGETRLNLQDHEGPYSVRWFNPRTGGQLQRGSVRTVWGAGQVSVGTPPQDPSEIASSNDWVCLVRAVEPIFDAGDRGNMIMVEAEHFESQRSDDVRKWHVLKKSGDLPDLAGAGEPTTWTRSIHSAAKTAGGGHFVRCLPDTRVTHDDALIPGENFSPEPGKMAILSYRVDFPTAGRYYVWVRAFSSGTEDNGIHVGLDGQWPEHGQRMQWCEGKHAWRWQCAQRTNENHCGEPMEIYLDVEKAGVHTVEFSMREDGFAMDAFVLTQDKQFRPRDVLWGESIRDAQGDPTPKSSPDVSQTMQFPASSWATGTPESQGFDPAKLRAALDYLEGHCREDGLGEVMLVRNGVCFFDGGRTDKVHNIWSCSKSFTSTALGLLIDDGKCTLDTVAADIEPSLKTHYPDVTLRHFTTMTSGYSAEGRSRWEDENSDWSRTPYSPEAPLYAAGKGYAYWDEAMMMFGRVLTRVAGRELNEYLAHRLFAPMDFGAVEWLHEKEVDGIPICNGCTNIKINAQQMARFGHLFLNQGNWNGKQLVPRSWVQAATQNQVDVITPVADTDRSNVRGPGAYGFNWWTNGGEYHMPLAPPKTFYASGLNHNVLFVIPEWDLVIVRMGVDGNPTFGKPQTYNQFIGKLAEAMIDHS